MYIKSCILTNLNRACCYYSFIMSWVTVGNHGHRTKRNQTTSSDNFAPLERTGIHTTFPSLSGAISVQNAHHSTEITPLTEISTPICGGTQETHHHTEGTEIINPNF